MRLVPRTRRTRPAGRSLSRGRRCPFLVGLQRAAGSAPRAATRHHRHLRPASYESGSVRTSTPMSPQQPNVSGVTPTGYRAEAAVAAARRARQDGPTPTETLRELMTARAQLRRYGNNLNQAARTLNAGGDPPEWLRNAIDLTDRAVLRIDQAVQDLCGRSRGRA